MSESTGYSSIDRNHTEQAHRAAQKSIYPIFFDTPVGSIQYMDGITCFFKNEERTIGLDLLDGWLGIDRILRVPAPVKLNYLEYTIQERFEREPAASHRNISITHLNLATGNPSELYKLKAHYFVSGYFNGNNFIGKAHVCSVERILKSIQTGQLRYYTKQNHKNQDFITCGYDDLEQVGAVLLKLDFDTSPISIYWPDKLLIEMINKNHNELMNIIKTKKTHHRKTEHARDDNVIDLFGTRP